MARSPLPGLFSSLVSLSGGEGSQASRKGEHFSLPVFFQKVPDPPLLAFLGGTPVSSSGRMNQLGPFSIAELGVRKHVVLICNSSMTYIVEHLVICFFKTWICSLVRYLFRSLPIFYLLFLLLSFKSCLYILGNSILSDVTFANIFSQSVACLLTTWILWSFEISILHWEYDLKIFSLSL